MKHRIFAAALCLLAALSLPRQASARELTVADFNCNSVEYMNFMDCFLDLYVDDTHITSASSYLLAAFCGDECRGTGHYFVDGDQAFWWLRVYSNATYGEPITLALYNTHTGEIVAESDFSQEFANLSFVGWVEALHPVTFSTAPGLQPGDTNGDGTINITDVVYTVNHILGHPASDFHPETADLNGDTVINVTDVVLLVNHILYNK